MTGFAKVPTALAADHDLSIGARAAYPIIATAAWRAGRRHASDGVQLPAVDALARELGCSRTAMTSYLKELRDTGWIHAVRRAPRRPARYWLLERRDPAWTPPDSGQNLATETRASDQILATEYGGVPLIEKLDMDLASQGPELEPPAAVKVGGRNLPLDALAEETGVDPKSPRFPQAIAALNGRNGQQGIRHLFWVEAERWAAANDARDKLDLLAAQPRFEQSLAEAVRRKAALYRATMNGAMLTPTALRSHWLDLELRPAGDRALTSDEIRGLDL